MQAGGAPLAGQPSLNNNQTHNRDAGGPQVDRPFEATGGATPSSPSAREAAKAWRRARQLSGYERSLYDVFGFYLPARVATYAPPGALGISSLRTVEQQWARRGALAPLRPDLAKVRVAWLREECGLSLVEVLRTEGQARATADESESEGDHGAQYDDDSYDDMPLIDESDLRDGY